MDSRQVRFGPFCLDLERRELSRAGEPLRLGGRALDILCELVAAGGQLVTKDELMARVWPGTVVEENAIQVHVSALRKVLDEGHAGPSLLATVPRRGYRFTGQLAWHDALAADARISGKPSIAVLPFANLSGDADQEYFADGIAEDIITDLARSRWFLVIARNSSFAFKGQAPDLREVSKVLGVRYVLEGSVRKSGDRVRITARLVDAAEDTQLWAQRYDAQLSDVFAVQDEITQRVAGAIEPELLRSEGLRAVRLPGRNLTAWDLVRQGTWLFHHVTRPTHYAARELFRRAVALDPGLAEAHMWLGRTAESIVGYGWSEQPATDLREAVQSCLRGVRLDERDPYGHYALSMSYLFSGALDDAIQSAERSAELSPSFALAHLGIGMARLYAGRAGDAVRPLELGLRLNPYDPQNFHWYRCLALAHCFGGDARQAVHAARQATQVSPEWQPGWQSLAVCLLAAGEKEEARRCAQRALALVAPASDVLEQFRLRNPVWAGRIASALRELAP